MGIFADLWVKWKRMKLPWRKHFLAGRDLAGNTFWEFKDQIQANRFRRVVRYNPRADYADVKISPQWHQWLRHTRPDPPSVQEQETDVARQIQLKHLAQLADERWASKPSFLDKPKNQPEPASKPRAPEFLEGRTEPEENEGVRNAVEGSREVEQKARGENPWKRERGGPSERWQPDAWVPPSAKR